MSSNGCARGDPREVGGCHQLDRPQPRDGQHVCEGGPRLDGGRSAVATEASRPGAFRRGGDSGLLSATGRWITRQGGRLAGGHDNRHVRRGHAEVKVPPPTGASVLVVGGDSAAAQGVRGRPTPVHSLQKADFPLAPCLAGRARHEEEGERLYALYTAAKASLQSAICESQAAARAEMLDGLNSDPWGKPYKRVRNKVRPWAPPLTQTLDAGVVREVVAALFPTAPAQHQPPQMAPVDAQGDVGEEAPEVGESELEEAVARLRKKSVAPGPDGIPGRAWVLAYEHLAPRVRGLFSACLAQALIPQRWKTGRLVLLRKEGRPAESPSAYRPIVLLDELAKLFERVVVGRLVAHLGQRGPDLSGVQFGFRSGRSTVDAILCVRAQVQDAVAQGDVVVAVSLDIANAFNTLPWSCIREALRYHGVPTYLRRVVGAYLSDRWVAFPGRQGMVRKEVVCGVPQGSVLGPLLWNIGYDWVLRGTLLRGVSVVCYADDTLVLARRPTYRDAAVLATTGVAQVVARIRRLGLSVALEKAEGIVFHGPRRAPPHDDHLIVGGTRIGLSGTMTYLGLVLDGRWKFRAHFERLVPRLLKVGAALSWLLPNVGGPGMSCRRLYTGVVRAMVMYGAPVWADALDRENIALLRRAQRVMAIRVVRGYRTISGEAACVLAGVLPWDLDAVSLASTV
ncbi:unnamed protein product [Euphydryas editha]|uniref:Reverse transcriptase domain-containing protein n=1 Tax=Euphydryas editha TaxID=104508 RepID=A0AAU9TVS9_EUPED|nr:unnamed protein product [Euphydryas editha]